MNDNLVIISYLVIFLLLLIVLIELNKSEPKKIEQKEKKPKVAEKSDILKAEAIIDDEVCEIYSFEDYYLIGKRIVQSTDTELVRRTITSVMLGSQITTEVEDEYYAGNIGCNISITEAKALRNAVELEVAARLSTLEKSVKLPDVFEPIDKGIKSKQLRSKFMVYKIDLRSEDELSISNLRDCLANSRLYTFMYKGTKINARTYTPPGIDCYSSVLNGKDNEMQLITVNHHSRVFTGISRTDIINCTSSSSVKYMLKLSEICEELLEKDKIAAASKRWVSARIEDKQT